MSTLSLHDLQGISTFSNTIRVPAGHKLSIDGEFKFPTWITSGRPGSPPDGTVGFNTELRQLEMYFSAGGGWITIQKLGKDGSAPAYAATSAKQLKLDFPNLASGTYWIDIAGTPTQIYCDMTTSGGGWMSFASADTASEWFPQNINGNVAVWSTMPSYNYGTYSYTGAIGEYWRDYTSDNPKPTEILFKTGNNTYWIHFPLSQIYASPNGSSHTFNSTASSNNFPDSGTYSSNTTVTVMHRNPNGGEDPWINAGNSHANGGNTSGTDFMFWGENNSAGHNNFRMQNGGILVFVR